MKSKNRRDSFMKLKIKKAIGILVAALMLTIVTTAFALEQVQGKNFADSDSDGVYDNYVPSQNKGSGFGQNGNFVDSDSDGVCDNYVLGQSKGNSSEQNGNFVDADSDGICDNYVSDQSKGSGSGQNGNFVDADSDGICDNYVPGQCQGNGFECGSQGRQGHGCRGRRNR